MCKQIYLYSICKSRIRLDTIYDVYLVFLFAQSCVYTYRDTNSMYIIAKTVDITWIKSDQPRFQVSTTDFEQASHGMKILNKCFQSKDEAHLELEVRMTLGSISGKITK